MYFCDMPETGYQRIGTRRVLLPDKRGQIGGDAARVGAKLYLRRGSQYGGSFAAPVNSRRHGKKTAKGSAGRYGVRGR